ncbi:MAG: GMC family oxidoreductase N-terminal domain-containing protein, partial [Candidatus Roizmanbacteria bacterium]
IVMNKADFTGSVYNIANGLQAAYTQPYSEVLKSDFAGIGCSVATMIGGGSSHNFGLVVKGSNKYWKQLRRLLGLKKNKLRETFAKVDEMMRITPLPVTVDLASRIIPFAQKALIEGAEVIKQAWNVLRNTGPLRANDFLTQKMLSAMTDLRPQVSAVLDYNDGETEVSVCQSPYLFLDKTLGVRWSANKAYLPESYLTIHKSHLHIIEEAIVAKVSDDMVELADGRSIRVKQKVIMATGGIYTPFLLQKSGFAGGIGRTLQNHYGCSLVMAIKGDDRVHDFSSGPVAFLPEGTGHDRDWEIVISGSTLTNFDFLKGQGVAVDELQKEGYHFVTVLLWLLHPKTRGSIDTTGDQPNINLHMFEDSDDNNSLVEAFRFLGKFAILFLGQLMSDGQDGRIVFPSLEVFQRDDPVELLDYVKKGVSVTDHYSATCSAGKGYDHPVDPETFRFKASSKIHVVDASVIPLISNGNTEYPVLVVAELAASVL